MTKMQPCAWINGQYQQVGQPYQSSQADAQLSHNTMRNQQTRNANNSCPITQAYSNRQPSNWQTSALSHQAVSAQQPVPGKYCYLTMLLTNNLKHLSNNTERGNPGLPVTNGFQQDFHKNPAQSSVTQSPPNMMNAKTTYPQQDMAALWNQSVRAHGQQPIRTQDGNVVADLQHCRNQNGLCHTFKGASTKPVSAYNTTAIQSPNVEVVYTAAPHNRPTPYNNNHRGNGSQHGFYPSIHPPSYNETISQSLRNRITTNSSSSVQNLQVSSQKTQQYSTYNNGGEATSSMNSNSYNWQHETSLSLSKKAEFHSNPAVDTQQEMLRLQKIAIIEDYLRQPVGSDGRPKTNHSVMSTQHSVVVPLEQSSVPNVFYVTAKHDGNGNGSKAAFPFLPKTMVGTLSDASQMMQLPEGISPQRNETQSFIPNNHERVEISVKANDSSIHSSPSRTRAVAVVQPLSQESYQFASKQCSSYTISQSPIKKPEIGHLAASNDGTYSDSASTYDLSKKQLCADNTESEVPINMQIDQCVALNAQHSVTSNWLVSQSGDEDKSEMPTDTQGVFDISSIPTTPWTPVTLTKLIQNAEKAQMELKELTKLDSVDKLLLSMFWDGNIKNMACKGKTGWYMDLIADVNKFCKKHVTLDSVILSQVKHCFREKLKNVHVLKDNEVYSELPYSSSWLNVNEQLDDIDKEFDFPWSLKHRLYTLESDSQPGQVETDNSIPVQLVSEGSNKTLSSTELSPADLGEEKRDSTVEASSTHTASPDKTGIEDSSNPYYSFKIKVLTQEEAKVIYEQLQSKLPKSMATDNQPERITANPVEDKLPKVIDATLRDTKLENESVCLVDQVCCVTRCMEIIWGSNTASLSKCECKNKQSHEDITDKTLDTEEMAVQKEGKKQPDGDKNLDNQVITPCFLELCNELNLTIDLTEDVKPHSYSDNEPNNISQITINSNQSSVILENEDQLSGSENEIPNQMPVLEKDLQRARRPREETKQFSTSETEIQSDPEVDCEPNQLKSCSLVNCDEDIEHLSSSESEVASQMSDLEENSGRAQMTNVVESSLETEEGQTQVVTGALQRKKRLSSHNPFFPLFKESKKRKSLADVDSQRVLEDASNCGKVFVGATDSEPSAANTRTVELVLFGSTPQQKCVLIGSRKSHISSSEVVFDVIPRPPKVLSVILSPLKRQSSETVPTRQHSGKHWLHEKSRIGFPPTKMRLRLKIQKSTFAPLSGQSREIAEKFGPANTEELAVSSEMRIRNGKTRSCLSPKRRSSHYKRLKRGGEKMEKHTVTLSQPAHQKRSKTENGRHAVMPLQNNDVLKFSILPSTFNFKDESSGRKESNDHVPDNSDLIEGKDKSHNTSVKRARGEWCQNPEKKCLFMPPTPKMYSLFHQFQKKYMEKMQPAVDE